MKTVFADTGYWIALLHPKDELHDRALEVSRDLAPMNVVTTDAVLTEWLNDFGGRGERLRHAAVTLVNRLRASSQVEVVPQSREQFDKALTLYSERSDKGWSLTDCVSFSVMSSRRIGEALAYDRHFEQAGYRCLLR